MNQREKEVEGGTAVQSLVPKKRSYCFKAISLGKKVSFSQDNIVIAHRNEAIRVMVLFLSRVNPRFAASIIKMRCDERFWGCGVGLIWAFKELQSNFSWFDLYSAQFA